MVISDVLRDTRYIKDVTTGLIMVISNVPNYATKSDTVIVTTAQIPTSISLPLIWNIVQKF